MASRMSRMETLISIRELKCRRKHSVKMQLFALPVGWRNIAIELKIREGPYEPRLSSRDASHSSVPRSLSTNRLRALEADFWPTGLLFDVEYPRLSGVFHPI